MKGFLVNRVLNGNKTQTRRIIDPMMIQGLISDHEMENYVGVSDWEISPMVSSLGGEPDYTENNDWEIVSGETWIADLKCPFKPGDLLWVRETFALQGTQCLYKANEYSGNYQDQTWTPAIHMKKKYCRLWLEIISVRAEQIQDVSREDCLAEGIETVEGEYMNYHPVFPEGYNWPTPFHSFQSLWESMPGGTECWKENGWVWVIEFKVVERRDYEK